MFSKHRLEALSDGIFAIVMTLLVLDLKVPGDPLPAHFAMHLAEEWISFLITFMIACTFWTQQHKLFALVEDIHQKTLVITFIFLGLISVLPFSTALLSQHINQRYAFVVYYTHTLLIAIALTVKLHMLVRLQRPADALGVQILKLRLHSMCLVVGTLALASVFVPIRGMGIIAGIAAVVVRLVTKSKRAALEALRPPAQPIA